MKFLQDSNSLVVPKVYRKIATQNKHLVNSELHESCGFSLGDTAGSGPAKPPSGQLTSVVLEQNTSECSGLIQHSLSFLRRKTAKQKEIIIFMLNKELHSDFV